MKKSQGRMSKTPQLPMQLFIVKSKHEKLAYQLGRYYLNDLNFNI